MKTGIVHPCLECPLPDCDETHRRCALRVALNTYANAKRLGMSPSEQLRERRNIANNEFYGIARNLRRRKTDDAQAAGAQ